MGDSGATATTTPLGSLFPSVEAKKAARRVEEAISDRRNELHRLEGFIYDNSALIHLVRTLPDELSHEIMVPFGGAAFFPGRLVHTNEYLLLIGENYYVERTAKQTVEILQRRGKALETQVDLLKGNLMDLEAEAKFFKFTAAEAAEAFVEIREEYIEEPENGSATDLDSFGSKLENLQSPSEDELEARLMERLDELEKEELEAGSSSGNDDDNIAVAADEDEDAESGSSYAKSDYENEVLELKDLAQRARDQESVGLNAAKQIKDSNMKLSTVAHSLDKKQSNTKENTILQSNPKCSVSNHKDSADKTLSESSQTSNMGSNDHKAFTGSIIEHSLGLPAVQAAKNTALDKLSGSNPSKPVSRFKMQRSNK